MHILSSDSAQTDDNSNTKNTSLKKFLVHDFFFITSQNTASTASFRLWSLDIIT